MIPAIIPQPARLTMHDGVFMLNHTVHIRSNDEARSCVEILRAALRASTGLELSDAPETPGAHMPLIEIKVDQALTMLGPEGYRLIVAPHRISMHSSTQAGLFYAMQTLRQLLPANTFGSQRVAEHEWSIACLEIEDQPRFAWRGAMLDVCRHFRSLDELKRFIDLLALHKLNRLHLHLTDDQGWRIEIKKYPRLTEVGGWRKETLVGHFFSKQPARYDGTPHGGFYTQDQLRELVAYAAARQVTIVPEIEMPGHGQAAIAAYPELGNTGQQIEVCTTWGVIEHIYNAEEATILFLQDVLTEVMGIFPSEYIHIGGDEAPKAQWQQSEPMQRRIRELGLTDEDALQSYFVGRMDTFLHEHGRKLVGWDEILEGGLAPHATVMAWRGSDGGIAAARQGHDVVMAPNHSTYFDYYQTSNIDKEPLAIGGCVPLEHVYHFNPIPKQLSEEQGQRVLGTQGQLWSEYMPTYAQVEYMAFPRLCALAEVAWTPQQQRDYVDFHKRLEAHVQRLDALGVGYRPLDQG